MKYIAHYRHPSTLKQSVMHLYNKILCLKIVKKVYEAEAAGLNYSIDGDFAPCKCQFITTEFTIFRHPRIVGHDLIFHQLFLASNNIELGDNLDLTVWGVNQKLTVLLDELLNEIENLKVTETEFNDSKKEQLEGKIFRNNRLDRCW